MEGRGTRKPASSDACSPSLFHFPLKRLLYRLSGSHSTSQAHRPEEASRDDPKYRRSSKTFFPFSLSFGPLLRASDSTPYTSHRLHSLVPHVKIPLFLFDLEREPEETHARDARRVWLRPQVCTAVEFERRANEESRRGRLGRATRRRRRRRVDGKSRRIPITRCDPFFTETPSHLWTTQHCSPPSAHPSRFDLDDIAETHSQRLDARHSGLCQSRLQL